jgi:hypothetical protein
LLLAIPPEEFARGIEGLEALGKKWPSLSNPALWRSVDPTAGMPKSYPVNP